MRNFLRVSTLLMIFVASLTSAQELKDLTAPTACEAQVQAQYQQLSTEGLVTVATAPSWGPQLTALVTQIRTGRHQYEMRKNYADLAEQNVAQLLEQLRLARVENGALKAEVERLKAPPAPAN